MHDVFCTVSPKCQSARRHTCSNKTKQNFGLTGSPNASSKVSAGTNNGEAPATLPPFRLALSMGEVTIDTLYIATCKSHKIK